MGIRSLSRRAVASIAALLAPLLLVALVVTWPTVAPWHGRALPTKAPRAPRAAPTHSPHTTARRRPNIVMVMADDMRVDDLLFAPHVRRLVARTGLTFDNSFAPYPLCCPDRASFLTGQLTHNHHVYSVRRPYGYQAFDDSRTLATSLKAAGYRTGFIGKYMNGYGPDQSLVSGRPSYRYVPRGWDDWRAAFENPYLDGVHGDTYDYLDTPFNVNGHVDNRYQGVYQTQVIGTFSVAMAQRFARRHQPFFMDVNFVAPHFGDPVEADDPTGMYRTDGLPDEVMTPARPGWVRGRFDSIIGRGAGVPKHGGTTEASVDDKPGMLRRPELTASERTAVRDVTRQRAEAVYVLDLQVARLVRELRRDGTWDDTVLMFSSDNGYYLGEHRQISGKAWAHEPSIRVPFLVTGPGIPHGQHRADPITTVDVAATILDLAHANPPRTPDGQSRLTTMRSGDQGWTTPVLDEAAMTLGLYGRAQGFPWPRTSIGVRTARWSLIRYKTGEGELYDLVTDPLENHNLYGEKRYLGVRAELGRLWWQLRNCRGSECLPALPADLAADASTEQSWTAHYWRVLRRTYGFSGH